MGLLRRGIALNRNERRRRDKEFARAIERGLDPSNTSNELIAALVRRTYERVSTARRIGSVDPIMTFLYSTMEKSERIISAVPAACAKGCWYCCTAWVATRPPEAIFFLKTLDAERRNRLATELAASFPAVEGLDLYRRSKIVVPCPALNANLCSNYPHRPIVCRTAASTNADACRRALVEKSGEDIPTPYPPQRLRDIFSLALNCALVKAGLDNRGCEFQHALTLAFEDPTLEGRWLGGERVFDAMPLDPRPSNEREIIAHFLSLAF